MRTHRGYTIVEVAVVLAVISVLLSIVIVGFNKVQSQTRDKKRVTDVATLQADLERYYEKHGQYPAGCFTATKSANPTSAYGACSSTTGTSTDFASDRIGNDSTRADIIGFLPDIGTSFGDPKNTNTAAPFGGTDPGNTLPTLDSIKYKYYYAGSHPVVSVGPVNRFGCPNLYDGQLGGEATSSYLIAYWSEDTGVYIFKGGRYGNPYEFKTTIVAPSYCHFS